MNEAIRIKKRVEELERRLTELEEKMALENAIREACKRKKPTPKAQNAAD